MKEKLTARQAQALGIVFMDSVEHLKNQIDNLGELKENTTEALRMVFVTNLKDGSIFEVGIIIRRKDEDIAIAETDADIASDAITQAEAEAGMEADRECDEAEAMVEAEAQAAEVDAQAMADAENEGR